MSFIVATRQFPGRDAVHKRGWLAAHKWLLLRRLAQLSLFALFLVSPWLAEPLGVWIIKGSLSASLLFGSVPMSDPFVLLQSLAAGHWPVVTAWVGLGVVLAFYLLVGGRSYCAWVCPINIVTDSAGWLRRRFGLKTGKTPPKSLRLWLLGATLLAAAVSGTTVWEWVNPVTLAQRAIIFGGTALLANLAWLVVAGIFLYDLVVAPRGWCGYVCPMGACYQLIGKAAVLRVAAAEREACNDCMDCFTVCPEPQVIRPALKGDGSRLISASDCTNCGRCIDVCGQSVFGLSHRFHRFEQRRDAS